MRSRCHRGCREASALPPPAWPPASPSPAQPSVKLTSGLLPGRAVLRAPGFFSPWTSQKRDRLLSPQASLPRSRNGGGGSGGIVPPLGLSFPEGGPRNSGFVRQLLHLSLLAGSLLVLVWAPQICLPVPSLVGPGEHVRYLTMFRILPHLLEMAFAVRQHILSTGSQTDCFSGNFLTL